MQDFDRTIAITGAGSGFGEALAHRFAASGYRVAVTDVNPERAAGVLAAIEDAGGGGFAQKLDVTAGPDWDALYQRVLTEWGGLEILVNNAGVAAAGRLEDTPLDDWKWILDIDLYGVLRGCHRFLPMLRSQGHGHLVNVASFAGMMTVPELSAYVTAKAAVVALSEQLRVDLEGSGVGITLVCPAYVQTRLLETFRSHDERHRQLAERWMGRSPVTATEVANQVYEAVDSGRFLVLTHRETRWLWRLRRWFPRRYHRTMTAMAHSMKARMQ
jgi:NADP-dependent 3-hydroxy acid dehydrogenase YdfG